MSLFKDMLRDSESLFKDTVALDYDFIPKLVPYRESEQRHIASCIKPLFNQRNGKNVLIHGSPGIGKTVMIKHLFKELEEQTDDIIPIYINCWQKNTTFKILLEICDVIGYRFTQNKKTDELLIVIKQMINKKSAVFCFDEVDKVEDFDFLYFILEDIYRKTILMITNYKDWVVDLDERIRSRLTLEFLEFRKYNSVEIKGILKHRMGYAFVEGVWEDDAFNIVAERTAKIEDIRSGLYLMKESGNIAEEKSSRKIKLEHVNEAIKKMDEFTIKKKEDLDTEEQLILKIVKSNSGKRIGDLFKVYQQQGGEGVYKTFQRKIKKLEENKFISVSKVMGGKEGTTTIVSYQDKKLTDF
jgi:archaeal cell division control protein 6